MVDEEIDETEFEDNGDSDEQDVPHNGRGRGGKTLVLMQDFEGYRIYRGASSFVVYSPTNTFLGYFTSLGSCVRQIHTSVQTEKAANRENYAKKSTSSIIHVIEESTKFINALVADLDNITSKMLDEKAEKQKKKVEQKVE